MTFVIQIHVEISRFVLVKMDIGSLTVFVRKIIMENRRDAGKDVEMIRYVEVVRNA